ncbi:hypothetical protein Tdes44962_MAKER08143 [Teratosphaeria destructans]|uniref:Uncharacterized protein n=1 Tax=Teratosphaeria destructans TaxID=418781 RepID=A0A9W7W5A6_9PEZI|nr:hypothetical protein Tdes44962_MAKER08143 [Teratosphaeria destructans]
MPPYRLTDRKARKNGVDSYKNGAKNCVKLHKNSMTDKTALLQRDKRAGLSTIRKAHISFGVCKGESSPVPFELPVATGSRPSSCGIGFSTTADVNRTGSDPTAVSLLAGLDPMWSKLDSAKFSHCAISYLQCELYPDPSKQPFYGTYMWQHEIGWCTSPSNCAGDPRPFASQRFNTTAVGDALWWTSGVFWNISSASHSVASHMKRFYRTIGAFDTAIARVLEGTDGLWDSWLGDLVLDYEDDLCYVDADCEGENALRGLGADLCFTKRYPTQPPPTTSSVYLGVKWLLTSNYSPFTWLPLSLLVPSRDSIKSAFLLPGHICISRARQRRVLAAIAEDLDGMIEYLAEDLARDCRRRLTGLQKVLHREGFWDYDPERPHIWVGEYLWDLPPPDMKVQGARRRDSQRYQGGRLEWDGTVQGWVEGYLSHACESLQPEDPYSYRLEDDNFQDAGIDTPLEIFMQFTSDLRSAAGLLNESALSTRGDYTSDRFAMFKPKRTLACTAPPVGLLREEIRGIGWVGEGPEMAEVKAFVSSRG